MSAAMTAQFVTDALVMAIWSYGEPDALVHHSDRGRQQRAAPAADGRSRRRLLDEPLRQRVEQGGQGVQEQRRGEGRVFDYIERFYDARRRQSTIGFLSPMEFERRAGFAYVGVIQTGGKPVRNA